MKEKKISITKIMGETIIARINKGIKNFKSFINHL